MHNTRLAAGLVVAVAILATQTPQESANPKTHFTIRPLTTLHHEPAMIHERHGNNVTSTNWSGYAVTGPNGSVTDVKGSWVLPALNCQNTPNASSALWVGIDGYSSNTVEQIGTDADCVNGVPTYYPWFEFYPHQSFIIDNFPLSPGSVISAEVKAGSKGQFSVIIHSGSQTFSTTTKVSSANQSSAEWIVEAPSSGGTLPLADFISASFGDNYTSVGGTSFATVRGSTQPIGPLSSGNVDQITMIGKSGAIKAQPSALASDNASFSDSWISEGP